MRRQSQITKTGNLAAKTDVDWYQMKVAEDGILSMEFAFDAINSAEDYYQIQLEQEDKRLVTYKVTGESGGCIQKWQISAGTYYIGIKPIKWSASIYTLCVK